MNELRKLEDHLAIVHVIQQVARAFDEKLHDELLPKAFDDGATILYRLRGTRIDFSMPNGLARFKYFRNDGSHNHWVIAAVYHDELVRRPEGWRVRKRMALCPYVEGDFLVDGVRVFPTLPDLDREGAP